MKFKCPQKLMLCINWPSVATAAYPDIYLLPNFLVCEIYSYHTFSGLAVIKTIFGNVEF